MPELGKYATEVMAAYGSSLLMLAALIAVSLRQGRRARAELARIEAQKNA